ncbi:MAG: sugar transferase [Candidatus Eisenbacteria sp.]|nr:sugar transferase [Candidatus Eisenbacteria bacterium]
MGHIERRKRETLIQFLWHLSDALAILAAFLIGYWLRFLSPLVGVLWDLSKGIPPLVHYLVAASASAIVWMAVFHSFGLYRIRRRWGGSAVSVLLKASLLGMVLTAGVTFFYRDVTLSRIAIPLVWMVSVPLIHVGRVFSFRIAGFVLRDRPLRFLVVGRTHQGNRIGYALIAEAGLPHKAVGILAGPGEDIAPRDGDPCAILGRYDEVGRMVAQHRIDRVIVALPLSAQEGLIEVMRQCRPHEVDVEFVPDLFSLISRQARFDEIDGIPIASLRGIPLAGWNGVVKRTLDLIVTIPLVVLFGPLLALLALIIRLDSPGPVFYMQERVGRDHKVFQMIKFRSMRVDAEMGTGPIWAEVKDRRRTRLGTFLRTWSLDELPQLLNVLKGEMSLVGPRPERPYFVDRFEDLVPGYFERHRVKSGLTGWAQVNGMRGTVPIEERTRYDLHYVDNWSLGLDLRILLMTFRSIFAQRGQ